MSRPGKQRQIALNNCGFWDTSPKNPHFLIHRSRTFGSAICPAGLANAFDKPLINNGNTELLAEASPALKHRAAALTNTDGGADGIASSCRFVNVFLLSADRQLPEGYAVVCAGGFSKGAEHETETSSFGEHHLRIAVRGERG
jgi:hypothetical protein